MTTSVMLVALIHTEPSCVLIRQFQLSLIVLALAPVSKGVHAAILDAFAHISAHMLRRIHQLHSIAAVLTFDIGEAIGVDEHI
eukprot:CAMPEP_0170454568 /NCGR_PEP_ID=MMETSP0123-20130129/2776_1 /TAXON_ID=182087 /ORGANISM="Favella ehrenbergii, Strain Fehren 1" /LENGTH=82 /DNA_ID=CAMNT_0010717323 /DNA_START=774 /DNA_END=1022 /DNA_ORIENTATION=-